MPGKNKQQKNAFYWYMQELMPQLKREGHVFHNGLADVVPIAHPRFKALEPRELQRFEDMAKEHKRRIRGQVGSDIRQDSAGNIIAQRRDVVVDYETAREEEVKELASHWPTADITDVEFCFADVQSLCKTSNDEYLPVEIALVAFSLKDGIKKTYHQFLRPPPLPTGLRFECMNASEVTHRLPVEGHEDATDNFLSVQNTIDSFINRQGKSSYPPIFAMREDWEKVNFTLNYINDMSGLGRHAVNFKLYEMESLLLAMVRHSGSQPPSKSSAAFLLNGSGHDFHCNLACDFHEIGGHEFCSLFRVKRFCYALAEGLENFYDYDLKPGTHLPTTKKIHFAIQVKERISARPQRRVADAEGDRAPVVFKTPANLPKTDSVLANPRVGRPAPVFRPPGAADLDYKKNKGNDIRYQQNSWGGPVHAGEVPIHDGKVSPLSYSQQYPSTLASSALPSCNTDLTQGREATWVPMKGAWSRRTTPASTPRATPLQTPRHSPPREHGSHFPAERYGVSPSAGRGTFNRQSEVPSLTSPIPPANISSFRASADDKTSLHSGFSALRIQSPGRGRGRGELFK